PLCRTLEQLRERCRLTPFDAAVLLLALAPQVDRRYGRLYAYLQDDMTRAQPTPGLAFDLFCDSLANAVRARSRFGAAGPLRAVGLIRLEGAGQSLLNQSIVMDERICAYLLGDQSIDHDLAAAGASLGGPERELVLAPEAAFAVEQICSDL